MKPEQQNRKYFTIAIYSLIVLLVGIGFVFLLWNFSTVKLYISKILDICSPIMYGALIAYILNPLMKIFEEGGIELSIGQWQKLSIARAFYSDSDILILDEPTASLDPMAEQEIFNRFDELRKDKTSIFVSHRLSSATTADKILVLEYGQLIESGSHRELMEAKGKYYQLFSTQAKRYIESANEIDEDMPMIPPMPPRRKF